MDAATTDLTIIVARHCKKNRKKNKRRYEKNCGKTVSYHSQRQLAIDVQESETAFLSDCFCLFSCSSATATVT
jgi:hypothetical protein